MSDAMSTMSFPSLPPMSLRIKCLQKNQHIFSQSSGGQFIRKQLSNASIEENNNLMESEEIEATGSRVLMQGTLRNFPQIMRMGGVGDLLRLILSIK